MPRNQSALTDTRVIYCGDNLDKLKSMPPKCVDLCYIDPPFNSNKTYEVFWGDSGRAERSFEDRHASTEAYINFMRPRVIELHRVLKDTGSFYFHCDWHASHYIKILLDQTFGESNFVNEVIWKRQSSHNDAKQGSKHLGRVHDTIFLYSKTKEYKFNHCYISYSKDYVNSAYRYAEPETGRRYSLGDLGAPGGAAPSKGNPFYEFLGVKRYWRFSKERMQQLYREGRIVQSKPGSVPRQKRYLDEGKGVPLGTVWDNIGPVQGQSNERVGYPTQKPLSLLEQIIAISSDKGDVILDAFCGCGTALIAAELQDRKWIGVDVSPTACRVVAQRLKDRCNLRESDALWRARRGFVIRDLPWTPERLREIPFFEFESWAVIALGGIPNQSKTGDFGIDGRIYLVSDLPPNPKGEAKGQMDFMDAWCPVQVKQKDKAGRPDIDAFETAMRRADRKLGFFVSFDYSREALNEIDRFERVEGRRIKPYTVGSLLSMDVETESRRLMPA